MKSASLTDPIKFNDAEISPITPGLRAALIKPKLIRIEVEAKKVAAMTQFLII